MKHIFTRWTGVAALSAALTVAVGCSIDDLLSVNNPDEIQVESLDDVSLLKVQLSGVVDAFDAAYSSWIVQYTNFATDEMITGLNWEDYARVNQRIISYLEGPTTGIFESLSRGLRQGDLLAGRIRQWQIDDPGTDFSDELATSLVFAGYSLIGMGENMCQTVISPDPDNPSGTVLEQMDIFDQAFTYLDEALTAASSNGHTALANLARVGLARAHLGRGNWANVGGFANAVDANFTWWLDYVDVSGGRNPLQGISNGGNFTHGIHPGFTGTHPSFNGTGLSFMADVTAPQTDPRIQHAVTDITGHNAQTRLYKFFQGLRYSDYSGQTIAPASAGCPACTGTNPATMDWIANFDTDIMLANYLEGQHHRMEALAMTDIVGNQGAIQTFVNARRAVGNQAPVTPTGQALITELRNQRARDLLMGGFRLGDLRRWTRFDAGNGPTEFGGSYFPIGLHPNPVFGNYGNWTCFPIPLSEYEGNANLAKPANPNTPPGI